MRKPNYKVDFAAHMAECEVNYVRLCKLLADMEQRDRWCFGLQLPDGGLAELVATVTERSKYTTTLVLQQKGLLHWLDGYRMSVRIYHDARMAEVLACQRGRHFAGRYAYPNDRMYQQDEKAQLNRQLGEWLAHCLQYGHTLESVAWA